MSYGKIGKSEYYVEELFPGDSFSINNEIHILTHDFKKDSSRLAIAIHSGISKWFKPETIVKKTDLYIINQDNHFVKIENVNTNNNEDKNVF